MSTKLKHEQHEGPTAPTVFISAYRSFATRYILYSDIFKELKESGAKIVLFVEDNDLEFHRAQFGAQDVMLEPVLFRDAMAQLRQGRIAKILVLSRRFISGHKGGYRNTSAAAWLHLTRNDIARGDVSYRHFQAARFLSMVGNTIPAVRKGLVELECRLFPGHMYDHYFEKYHPQMLIVSTMGYFGDPYFMRAARRHGCKVVSIIHSWDVSTTKDYRGAVPDYVITWNDIMKREVNVFHDIPNDRIMVGGVAHWDFYSNGQFKPRSKAEFLESNELSPDRKVIFFATTNPSLSPRTFDVIEALLEAIRQEQFLYPAQLLVRLHPNYYLKDNEGNGLVIGRYADRVATLERTYGKLVVFNAPMVKNLNDGVVLPFGDMFRLAETLHHSDVLLTQYSTVAIEAAILDVPIVNLSLYNFRDTDLPYSYYNNYTHVRDLLRPGALRMAYTTEEMIQHINYYFEDRSRDRDQRQRLVDQYLTTNRGHAGKSIGKMLLELLSRTKIPAS